MVDVVAGSVMVVSLSTVEVLVSVIQVVSPAAVESIGDSVTIEVATES